MLSPASNLRFQSNPPEKPPIFPFAAARDGRDEDRDRVRPARATHGADGLRPADGPRDVAVALRPPGASFRSARQTACWNSVLPAQSIGGKFFGARPARTVFSAAVVIRCQRRILNGTRPPSLRFGATSGSRLGKFNWRGLLRIARGELAGARGRRQFPKTIFHVSDGGYRPAECRTG